MFNTIVGDGAVGARAASRYGSVSDQMMRLRLRNNGKKASNNFFYVPTFEFTLLVKIVFIKV
jgi:hypothetical protein